MGRDERKAPKVPVWTEVAFIYIWQTIKTNQYVDHRVLTITGHNDNVGLRRHSFEMHPLNLKLWSTGLTWAPDAIFM